MKNLSKIKKIYFFISISYASSSHDIYNSFSKSKLDDLLTISPEKSNIQ